MPIRLLPARLCTAPYRIVLAAYHGFKHVDESQLTTQLSINGALSSLSSSTSLSSAAVCRCLSGIVTRPCATDAGQYDLCSDADSHAAAITMATSDAITRRRTVLTGVDYCITAAMPLTSAVDRRVKKLLKPRLSERRNVDWCKLQYHINAQFSITRSFPVAERPRDSSCLVVASFNSTISPAKSVIISHSHITIH